MGNKGNQVVGADSSDPLQEGDDGSIKDPVPLAEDPMDVDDNDASDPKVDPLSAENPPVWDPAPFRRSALAVGTVQTQALPQGAPIPSPLATLGRRQSELAAVVNDTVASVRDLWHLCANTQNASGANLIRHEIVSGRLRNQESQYLDDADVGFVAWFERASTLQKDETQASGDESSDDEDPPATDTLRHRWVTRERTNLSKAFESEPGGASSGQQGTVFTICRSRRTDGETAHFIIHSSQSTVTVNGIRVPPQGIAGPLPPFAVIEFGVNAVFWWRDSQSLGYLPLRPTKNYQKRSRALDPEEELENFNDDEAPLTKRTKLVENPPNLEGFRRSARIASGKATGQTGFSGVGPTRRLLFSGLPPRGPQSTKTGPGGPLPRNPPKTPQIGRRPSVKPRAPSPRIKTPPKKGPNVPLPTLTTWKQQFQERLNFWRDERERAGNRGHAHQVRDYDALNDTDVVSAIASVWRPLIDWGTSHAFGSADLFQAARMDSGLAEACLRSPNPFVIPLLFNKSIPPIAEESRGYSKPPPVKKPAEDPETAKKREAQGRLVAEVNETPKNPNAQKQAPKLQTKTAEEEKVAQKRNRDYAADNTVGHFVLAVAERVPSSGNGVRLRFWDSAPGAAGRNSIRGTARQIVRNSGWLPPDVWPMFVNDEDWAESPRQHGLSCGLHVVLNAWAYMLNIPINPKQSNFMKGNFYHEALEIINLALRGLMDATTIRAFLQSYDYAVPRRFEDAQRQETSTMPDVRRDMHHLPQTTLINEEILGRIINRLENLAASQASAEEAQRYHGPRALGQKPRKKPTPPGPIDEPPSHGGSSPPKTPPLRKQTPPKQGPSLPRSRKTSPRKTSSSTRGTSSAGPPKSGTSSPPGSRLTWEELLRDGIARHRDNARQEEEEKKMTEEPKEDLHLLLEKESGALDDDHVSYAIASIWHGLRVGSTDKQAGFAFGEPMTFRLNRTSAAGMPAVGSPYPLIIPMLFPRNEYPQEEGQKRVREQKAKGGFQNVNTNRVGGVGHFVLGIAERTENDVRLDYMDSAQGSISPETIKRTARALVSNTGWMGIDASGNILPATPNYIIEITRLVPAQRLRNNCGFHVIINAWAYMLGIPIHRDITRRRLAIRGEAKHDAQFYVVGKRIMNLALRGHMDSRTIQAFFNVYGYSKQQDPNNQDQRVRDVNAQRMNLEILHNIVEDLREQEVAAELAKLLNSTSN